MLVCEAMSTESSTESAFVDSGLRFSFLSSPYAGRVALKNRPPRVNEKGDADAALKDPESVSIVFSTERLSVRSNACVMA